MYDLAIHGRIFAGRLASAWVYIKDGEIAKVSGDRGERAAAVVELAPDQILIPAATDLHVHLRDWEQAQKETIETGTKSALAGGVTTVAEMPNTLPRLDSAEVLARRMQALEERSFTDFAVHAAVPQDAKELIRLKKAGAFALKLYPPDLGRLDILLKECEALRMKVAVHAEEQTLVGTRQEPRAEVTAVASVLRRVAKTTVPVRFAHLSSYAAVVAVASARRKNKVLSVEVSPHHLFMNRAKAISRIGVAASHVRPPLRSGPTASRMRGLLLADGGRAFDFLATDHAPHTVEEKRAGAAPGFPGLEFALPLFLSKTGDIRLLCRLFCEAPAEYLGIRKGKIAPGYLADVVVLSAHQGEVDPERFFSMGRVTPFAGEMLDYRVDEVLMRGETVYRDRKFTRTASKLATR